MSNSEYMLEMHDICKEFPGVKALNNARLFLRAGTIHALMGENGAGKSTLMNCLFGICHLDSGKIIFNKKKIIFNNPKQALDNGISMVHQELNQVQKTSVMENIWLGRFPMNGIVIDEKKMYIETKKIFNELDINIDPKRKIETLSISEKQMVEIAKAVSYDSKIVVMDEPTSSLTEKEVNHLFCIIRKLKEKKCGIIYISHKMEEILEISDEVTVMRDGQWIGTNPAHQLTIDKIIKMMVGRDLTHRFPHKDNVPGEVILEVKNLTARYQPSIKDVSFFVRKGEILGIAGLVGAKRTDIVETIFGIRKKEAGEIIYRGKTIKNENVKESMKNGFSLLTEDRSQMGIFGVLSVKFNAIIANIKEYSNKVGIINDKKADSATKWIIDRMNIKTPSLKTQVQSLSGGNQQKLILGRCLLTEPDILLVDEPTRGIDVGAKFEIYQLIIDLAKKGKSIVFISSEMPELLGISDRILVMSNGRVSGILDDLEIKEIAQEKIMRYCAQYL